MKGVLRKTTVVAVGVVVALGVAGCGTSKPARKNVLTPQPSATGDSVALFRSLHVDQDMVKAGKAGRWAKRPMRPTYITIHATENYSRSADAHQHAKALQNGALRGRNSLGYLIWHFTVDDHCVVQHMPLNERGEHADFDGPGNRRSIGIEMCENRGSNRAVTTDRAARLAGVLMHAYGIPLRNVVPHYHWARAKCPGNPHKNCPHYLLDNKRPGKTWNYFLARVNHYARIARDADAAGGRSGPNPVAMQMFFERGSMIRQGYYAGR